MNDLVSTATESAFLLENLKEDTQSYHLPFPMAVFGTLRQGCGNHPLMGSAELQHRYRENYTFLKRFRAFLPNFVAKGISIYFQANSCCPFEVYTYDAKNWQEMIRNVDRLESFYPGETGRRYGYNRTLANLHILPEEFEHPLFPANGRPNLSEVRNLAIPKEDWDKFPRLPCWVYSSGKENEELLANIEDAYPLIWYNTKKVKYKDEAKAL